MPNYDYKCECGKLYTIYQRMADEKFTHCKDFDNKCKDNHKVTRLLGTPMIISDDIGRGTKRMTDKKLYKELEIE